MSRKSTLLANFLTSDYATGEMNYLRITIYRVAP